MADLIAAARAGDVERVRALVAAEPALASARDENGLPAVLVALFNGHRPVAEALAEAGAELGVLEAAALGRAGRLRELLAAAPAALAARTPEGFDPIGLAAFLGGAEAVRVLLDHGADRTATPPTRCACARCTRRRPPGTTTARGCCWPRARTRTCGSAAASRRCTRPPTATTSSWPARCWRPEPIRR